MNTVLMSAQGSLRPVPCRPDHSVSTHLTCPDGAFARYPSASVGSRRLPDEISSVDADSSLTSGRIEFVILRTGRSPSIAPHLASRRRSYRGVRAGERLPGEDFHLSVMAPLQAHVARRPLAGVGREAGSENTTTRDALCEWLCFSIQPPSQPREARRDQPSVRLPLSSARCLRGESVDSVHSGLLLDDRTTHILRGTFQRPRQSKEPNESNHRAEPAARHG